MSQYLEIKIQRCLVLLTEKELLTLLARDPNLWALALRRGKGVMRSRAAREREPKARRDYST